MLDHPGEPNWLHKSLNAKILSQLWVERESNAAGFKGERRSKAKERQRHQENGKGKKMDSAPENSEREYSIVA